MATDGGQENINLNKKKFTIRENHLMSYTPPPLRKQRQLGVASWFLFFLPCSP
jgi:hypothetical protein